MVALKKNDISKLYEEWKISPSQVGKVQKIGEETFKGLFTNLLITVTYLFGLLAPTLARPV
jgi:hypothetical protein